ncbi:hypothetical protein M5689_012431 [Euphorbia peplus]|nr:hypothetical protein M5689_012431 [Euphorbia peplus]
MEIRKTIERKITNIDRCSPEENDVLVPWYLRLYHRWKTSLAINAPLRKLIPIGEESSVPPLSSEAKRRRRRVKRRGQAT